MKYYLIFEKKLPLKSGLLFQIAIGPKLANCPRESSRKNRGMPTSRSVVK